MRNSLIVIMSIAKDIGVEYYLVPTLRVFSRPSSVITGRKYAIQNDSKEEIIYPYR